MIIVLKEIIANKHIIDIGNITNLNLPAIDEGTRLKALDELAVC